MRRANALSCAIGIFGMLAATAAFAADEPEAHATRTETARQHPLICRDRLRPGSHIATRTCLTAAQWAARSLRDGGYAQNGGVYDGLGPWGQVSTVGQSVGASAFTAR